MHAKTIQKIQKAYIKTYEEDVKIYKDIENSQGQGAFFFCKHRYVGLRWPPVGPKMAQDRSLLAQVGLKTPKMASRDLQNDPTWPQSGLKMTYFLILIMHNYVKTITCPDSMLAQVGPEMPKMSPKDLQSSPR